MSPEAATQLCGLEIILALEPRLYKACDHSAMTGGWSQPSMADRGREVGDLGIAGLNIGAPARLQRGGRVLPPTGASTPLGRNPEELPRTCTGSSARAGYRQRLELDAQDSDEDVFFRRAGAGENGGSPPEHQQDETEYEREG